MDQHEVIPLLLRERAEKGMREGIHRHFLKCGDFGTELPTIFMTGHADEMSQRSVSDVKVTAVLQKPFSAGQLVDVVNRSLSGFA